MSDSDRDSYLKDKRFLGLIALTIIAVVVTIFACGTECSGRAGCSPDNEMHSDGIGTTGQNHPLYDRWPVVCGNNDVKADATYECQEEQRYNAREDLEAQRRMAVATERLMAFTCYQVGIAGFGVLLVGFTLFFTARAAESAKLAAQAAVDAKDIANSTRSDINDSSRRELRAYLSIVPGNITFARLTPTYVDTVMKNHGQTPAHKVSSYTAIFFAPYPLPRDFDPGVPEIEDSNLVIFPGMSFPTKRKLGREISTELLKELQSGSKRLFLFSFVTYIDIFKEERQTNLCVSLAWSQVTKSIDHAVGVGSKKGPGALSVDWDYEDMHNDAT